MKPLMEDLEILDLKPEKKIKNLVLLGPLVKKEWMKNKDLILIDDVEVFKERVKKIEKECKRISLDLETTGLNVSRTYLPDGRYRLKDEIVGFSFGDSKDSAFYVPVKHSVGKNIPIEIVLEQLKKIIDKGIHLVMHNSKFDVEFLCQYWEKDLSAERFEDTEIMAFLEDTEMIHEIGLKKLIKRLLGWELYEFEDLFPEKMKKKDRNFATLDPTKIFLYPCGDAIATYNSCEILEQSSWFKKQEQVYKIEKKLVNVIRRMESNKIKIDVEYARKIEVLVKKKIEDISEEIFKLSGSKFNLNSSQQLYEVLFKKLNLKLSSQREKEIKKRTKTGISTDEDVLKDLKGQHSVVEKVLVYRGYEKMLNTYIKNLVEFTDDENRIRISYSATGAQSGRIVSRKGIGEKGFLGFSIQTVAKEEDDEFGFHLRRAFVAREGFVMCKMDYQGEEIRLAGNLSQEPFWIETINQGLDPHYEMAKFLLRIEKPTEKQRQLAKTTAFGLIYGMTEWGLAQTLGIGVDAAKRIKEIFLSKIPYFRRYVSKQQSKALEKNYVTTAFGRIRRVYKIDRNDKNQLRYLMNIAMNDPIQGTGADIIKIVMVKVDNLFHRKGWLNDALMLISNHDELVFEIRKGMVDEIVVEIKKIMESIRLPGWKIPLTVEVKIGRTWGEDKEVEKFEINQALDAEKEKLIKDEDVKEQKIELEEPKKQEVILKEEEPKEWYVEKLNVIRDLVKKVILDVGLKIKCRKDEIKKEEFSRLVAFLRDCRGEDICLLEIGGLSKEIKIDALKFLSSLDGKV